MLDILKHGIANLNVNLEYNLIGDKTIAKVEME